jgi:hypothetical protein
VIGDGATIAPGVRLQDITIATGATIDIAPANEEVQSGRT